MDWQTIIIVILAIFLFIKVISKLVRLIIGVAIIGLIAYFVLNMNVALIMM